MALFFFFVNDLINLNSFYFNMESHNLVLINMYISPVDVGWWYQTWPSTLAASSLWLVSVTCRITWTISGTKHDEEQHHVSTTYNLWSIIWLRIKVGVCGGMTHHKPMSEVLLNLTTFLLCYTECKWLLLNTSLTWDIKKNESLNCHRYLHL